MALEQLVLQPIDKIVGHVKLPGSKSLSNRILLLAALSEGTTLVKNLLVRPSPTLLSISVVQACISFCNQYSAGLLRCVLGMHPGQRGHPLHGWSLEGTWGGAGREMGAV